MWIDLGPLKRHPDFRLLFIGQWVSALGTMTTYIALPYQVHLLTESPLLVGLLGAVQLIPVLLFSLIGGLLADAISRKNLLLYSEACMALAALGLWLNSLIAQPSLWGIFALAFVLQSASALHRPTLDALRQSLVEPYEYPALGALNAFQGSSALILGPALGGSLMAWGSPGWVYIFDLFTFIVALLCIRLMHVPPQTEAVEGVSWSALKTGLQFAQKRPVLLGSYLADILAMTFAFPLAIFPILAEPWGEAQAAGLLFAAMPIGSLLVTLISAQISHWSRHGAAIIIAAFFWGLGIIGLGLSSSLIQALFCLTFAGAADMVSGLFRSIIWNDVIPNHMRGRLAGLEMISYLAGPLLGNLRVGYLAESTSVGFAIWSGGLLCMISMGILTFTMPTFWQYQASKEGTKITI